MADNSDMDNASMNSNPMNHQNQVYICNISRWVPERIVGDVTKSLAVFGNISYELIEKNYLSHNNFNFLEFTQDNDAQEVFEAWRESKSNENDKKEMSASYKEEIIGPTLIDKLSIDCLIKIFSYLPIEKRLEMEDVCIGWRDISKRAWHNIQELHARGILLANNFTYYSKFIEKLLMRCGVYLRTLKLNLVCSPHILPVIGEYCQNLTTIHLILAYLEKSDIEHFGVLSKLKKLQSFTLKGVRRQVITPAHVLNCLLNLSKTVKSICIDDSSSDELVFKTLQASIANPFEKFNVLDSLEMENYTIEKCVIEAISNKATITKLNLANCKIDGGLNLLTNLSNLKHLDLQDVRAVDDDFLAKLSTKCRKLKHLNVTQCNRLSDEGIRKLKNLDNLEELSMISLSDRVTDLPLGQLRGIKRLNCTNCFGVRDPGIMQLIKNCPDLEELRVHGTSISKETPRFAISVTKHRTNSLILYLFAELNQMEFDVKREEDSPFLKFEDTGQPVNHEYNDLDFGYSDSDTD